jgi:hypothetical protein
MRGEPAIDESDFNLSFNVASGVSSQDRPIPAVRDRFLISYICNKRGQVRYVLQRSSRWKIRGPFNHAFNHER